MKKSETVFSERKEMRNNPVPAWGTATLRRSYMFGTCFETSLLKEMGFFTLISKTR
jgi:hypothetical protein